MGWLTIGLDGVLSGRAERKRKWLRGELVNVCPHMDINDVDTDGGLNVHCQWWFETPFGTTSWFCRGCGLKQSEFGIRHIQEDWARRFNADPKAMMDDYFSRVKQRNKIVEKLNRYGGA